MHLKDINIVDSFNVTGKGKALVTDLNYDSEYHRFKKGDTLRYDDKIYEILSIEAILAVGHKEYITFITKEITIGALFDKKNKQSIVENNHKWYFNLKVFFKRILKLN